MVELLSPAGEYASMVGAFSAGADAVYLAGNMYGARASAVNFDQEELIKAIHYAHLLGKKIYLTVNTLTKDEELERLYSFLRPLYLSGLDAVIVQDIGVFLYIKSMFKDLDIHVSTQAAVTSSYGASFYKNLGAQRVVLARELTLEEIKNITPIIETECFIHGAMCYSYSGMCLFSSFLGGNSGNRGRCKGPCRQPYSIGNNRNEAYYLSLSDMNTIEVMDKLIDAGIYSFKIEGRLKSPSYSAGVTGVYRKYIDYSLENPGKELKISEEDKDLLKNLYSRKSCGTGYYFRTSSPKMITFEKGAYLKVDDKKEEEITNKYIDNPLKINVDFSFAATPGEKAKLTCKAVVNNKEFECAVYSDDFIEEAKKIPTSYDDVLKQLKKTGNTFFVLNKLECNLNNSFVPSSLLNNLRRDCLEKLETQIYFSDSRKPDDFTNIKPNNFENHNENKNSGTDSFCDSINGKKQPDFGDIKFKVKNDIENIKIYDLKPSDNKEKKSHKVFNRAFVKNIYQFKTVLRYDFYDSIVINKTVLFDDDFENTLNGINKKIYIELPPVLRFQNKKEFETIIDYAKDKEFICGIYANQYDALEFAYSKRFNKEIHSNSNVYSYNELSLFFNSLLFDSCFAPMELKLGDFTDNGFDSYEFLMYGRAPLMHTANCILKTSGNCQKKNGVNKDFINLKDRLGVDFKVNTLCDDYLCFNTIYNSKPTSLHKYFDALTKNGCTSFIFSFTDENAKEIEEVTKFFTDVSEGLKNEVPFEFTAYHIKNGIL